MPAHAIADGSDGNSTFTWNDTQKVLVASGFVAAQGYVYATEPTLGGPPLAGTIESRTAAGLVRLRLTSNGLLFSDTGAIGWSPGAST